MNKPVKIVKNNRNNSREFKTNPEPQAKIKQIKLNDKRE